MREKNQDSMETVGVLSNKNCVGSVCTIDARFSPSSVPSPLRMYASPLIYRETTMFALILYLGISLYAIHCV